MTPFYTDDAVTLFHGDCLEVLASLPDASVDSVVTDPPYGLSFMGKEWDAPARMVGQDNAPVGGGSNYFKRKGDDGYVPGNAAWYGHTNPTAFQAWATEWAAECLRVLKPGGHMLAFGGSRTWHRLTCAVEDAGFEIRDSIAWLYGSGFPKSLDVSKAIDKAAGAEPIDIGESPNWRESKRDREKNGQMEVRGENAGRLTAPATPDAQRWQGWGTALKPAFEPVVVARKPLSGTVAQTVLAHGTGALNIDATRVGTDEDIRRPFGTPSDHVGQLKGLPRGELNTGSDLGRWPSNVVLDESQAAELDRQSGERPTQATRSSSGTGDAPGTLGFQSARPHNQALLGESGGASRFFPTFRYEPKAPTTERPRDGVTAHPTVKPLDLMRWLVRLVTPPGGTVLEPFAGSGTTAEACVVEGFKCVAIEREADYLPLIVQRLTKPIQVALEFD